MSKHRAQISEKMAVKFFFEFKCLTGTLGNLLQICCGNFLIL